MLQLAPENKLLTKAMLLTESKKLTIWLTESENHFVLK